MIRTPDIWRSPIVAALKNSASNFLGRSRSWSSIDSKVHLGRISKKGEAYLRRLLVLGATAVVRCARNHPTSGGWINALLARRPAQ